MKNSLNINRRTASPGHLIKSEKFIIDAIQKKICRDIVIGVHDHSPGGRFAVQEGKIQKSKSVTGKYKLKGFIKSNDR